MMNRLSRSVRMVILLFAAMQFAVPAVVSVADGAVARVGPEQAPHVEGLGTNACARIHPADCLLCRVLSTTISPPRGPVSVPVVSDVQSPSRTLIAVLATTPSHGFNSRAPPTFTV